MDSSSPAFPLTRIGAVVCLAILCWVALRVWVAEEKTAESFHPTQNETCLGFLPAPPGVPMIDWSQFRFPALEVSLDDADQCEAESLLKLLQPQRVPSFASPEEPFAPRLELSPLRRRSASLSPSEFQLLTLGATPSDDWTIGKGAYYPWSIGGLNTGRAWNQLGRGLANLSKSKIGPRTEELASGVARNFLRWCASQKQFDAQQFAGPPLIVAAGDRIAMVQPITPTEEGVSEFDPIEFALPATLLAQLELLAENPWTAAWASHTDREIRELCSGEIRNAARMTAAIERIAELSRQARHLADECRDPQLQTDLKKAHFGILRRLIRWQLAAELHHRRTQLWAKQSTHRRLCELIDRDATLQNSVREAVISGRRLTPSERRALANAILANVRLADRDTDAGSRLSGVLDDDLRFLATGAIDVPQLFAEIEMFESGSSPVTAAEIVARQRELAISSDRQQRALASEIAEHYRNANFRLAVSEELLNRWLPAQSPVVEPVRDRIAGSPVRGESQTQTELYVRLLPDPFIWRVGLEASGDVAARTTSGTNSVSIHTTGATSFLARKLLLVRADGVQSWPAVAEADTSQQLLSISSKYDGVPFMGNYVRSQASEEYRHRRERARREVEAKVSGHARAELDERTKFWLADIESQFRSRLLQRTQALGLDVTPIELRTTDRRLIARLRLAGVDQLAAYTPRPMAPADSALSVQLHETALNNALAGLKLNDRRLSGAELAELLTEKLELEVAELPTAAVRTMLEFSDNPVQVQFAEGQAHVVFALREMVYDRTTIRDFRVHAFYHPQVDGLSAKLVRAGSLQMEGRLRHSERAKLHAVFGKVLADDRAIELVRFPKQVETAQRLVGLTVTQLAIDDGWLGLSIGPGNAVHTAARTRYAKHE